MLRLGWLALWWIGMFWLWIVYAGELTFVNAVAGFGAATLGATVFELVRRQGLLRLSVDPRLLRAIPRTLLQVPIDFGIVVAAPFLRRDLGAFRRRPTRENGAGDRAAIALLATFSPNAYAIEVADGRVLLHDLIVHEASESPA